MDPKYRKYLRETMQRQRFESVVNKRCSDCHSKNAKALFLQASLALGVSLQRCCFSQVPTHFLDVAMLVGLMVSAACTLALCLKPRTGMSPLDLTLAIFTGLCLRELLSCHSQDPFAPYLLPPTRRLIIQIVQMLYTKEYVFPAARKHMQLFFVACMSYTAIRGWMSAGIWITTVSSLLQTAIFLCQYKADLYWELLLLYRKMWTQVQTHRVTQSLQKKRKSSLWKKLVCDSPGLLTLILTEDKLFFTNSQFFQQFKEFSQDSGVGIQDIKSKFGQIMSTNSCIEGSLWQKVVNYIHDPSDLDSLDDPKILGEFVLTQENDVEKAVNYSAKAQKIKWNKEPACVLQITDITGHKKAQNEILCRKYKNLLFTTASHEIKTPLNGILGGMQLILHSNDLSNVKEYSKIIVCSCKLLQNITDDMLDYCLYEGGNLSLNIDSVRLHEVFMEAIEIIEAQTKQRGVRLDFKCDPSCPTIIKNDRKRLLQILLNLLGNAAKYTFNGSITITVESREFDIYVRIKDTGIGISEAKKEGLFKLFGQVGEDKRLAAGACSGLGLAISQVLASLLGSGISFTSVKGVGSEFCFAINKLLNKKRSNSVSSRSSLIAKKPLIKRATLIWRRSDKTTASRLAGSKAGSKNGSKTSTPILTASTRLQLQNQASTVGPSSHRKSSLSSLEDEADNFSPAGDEFMGCSPRRFLSKYVFTHKSSFTSALPVIRRKKCNCPDILIVDDNAFNLFVLQNLLEKLKFKCLSAVNGEDAIEKALKFVACDCNSLKGIIMDCEMPVKNGFEASQELVDMMARREIREVPIIACTAFIDDTQKTKCFECGMKAYMSKPVMLEELRATVDANHSGKADMRRIVPSIRCDVNE